MIVVVNSEQTARRQVTHPEYKPTICKIVDYTLDFTLAHNFEISSLSLFKKDIKGFYLHKMGCNIIQTDCDDEIPCDNVIFIPVSCNLCAYPIDDNRNKCALPLDTGTTYVNILN